MTPVERPLHHKLFAEAGLTLADAENAVRSPANTAYVDHHVANGVAARPWSDRRRLAALYLDLPPPEGRSGPVGASVIRSMDPLLR